MEDNINEIKYSIVVPYNNSVMVAARKKQKIFASIITFLSALIFGFFTIMAATAENSSLAVSMIFGIFAGVCVAY